jgi:YidC/Oxa1 family membrane protein insertase
MSSEDGTANQAAAMTQSMTTIMPIMMGMFSLSFSVGLSIYFVVSNMISIIQYSRQPNFKWSILWTSNRSQGGSTAPAAAVKAKTLKEKIEAEREARGRAELPEGESADAAKVEKANGDVKSETSRPAKQKAKARK